ncbi:hypothetical protein Q9R32_00885 [Actinotalea sp. AC32]|nr:hypothetical protein [Actinotalea sp. AC32]
MTSTAIDPDGVLAMSAATLLVSASLDEAATDLQREIDDVAHLVTGAPFVRNQVRARAGDLAELAGWARELVLRFVDHERPISELLTAGYWLPDFSKLGWDRSQSAGDNVDRTARSDEFGAFVLGTSGALLERYRRFSLAVPRPGATLPSLDLPAPDDVVRGTPVVRRPSGLLVIQGSAADPHVGRLAGAADSPAFYPRDRPTFVTDPDLGRPPTWARTGGRALGVLGSGLTLYDSYMSQWEHDAKYHPEWGTGERVASAAYNTVTEGGGAVAGGIVGAQIGATVGSFVPIPVVGTVGGALIGGAVGSFVGSKVGKATGRLLEEAVSEVGDTVKDAWNSLFG